MFLTLFVFFSVISPSSIAQPTKADAIKAAFVFNFAKFTTWPPPKTPTEILRICFEANNIDPAVFANWDTKRIHGAPVEARTVSSNFDGVASCHLVFVGHRLDEQTRTRLLQLAQRYNLLLVSDVSEFATRGGHISLIESGGRMRFQVNLEATRLAGLSLSSQLLRVAEIVDG